MVEKIRIPKSGVDEAAEFATYSPNTIKAEFYGKEFRLCKDPMTDKFFWNQDNMMADVVKYKNARSALVEVIDAGAVVYIYK